MTLDEFFDDLKAHQINFQQERYDPQSLRDEEGRCPLCALAWAKLGQGFDNADYDQASQALGLDHDLDDRICYAADHNLNDPECDTNIRQRLLAFVVEGDSDDAG
jgi:hypothetical protein